MQALSQVRIIKNAKSSVSKTEDSKVTVKKKPSNASLADSNSGSMLLKTRLHDEATVVAAQSVLQQQQLLRLNEN